MAERTREDMALKPIGFALAAVVSGLAAPGVSALEPVSVTRDHAPEPAADPRAEEDASLLLGPSEAVEPFAETPAAVQPDLFDL